LKLIKRINNNHDFVNQIISNKNIENLPINEFIDKCITEYLQEKKINNNKLFNIIKYEIIYNFILTEYRIKSVRKDDSECDIINGIKKEIINNNKIIYND
jgi:hypothetical protein